jgi:hypothetical protein
VVEFYLKLKLILRIISYLTYICWETDNFVIKSDIFRRFFICKNILKKLSCYHDNNFRYFMFGKYNGFVSKARVSACMYFLVSQYSIYAPCQYFTHHLHSAECEAIPILTIRYFNGFGFLVHTVLNIIKWTI